MKPRDQTSYDVWPPRHKRKRINKEKVGVLQQFPKQRRQKTSPPPPQTSTFEPVPVPETLPVHICQCVTKATSEELRLFKGALSRADSSRSSSRGHTEPRRVCLGWTSTQSSPVTATQRAHYWSEYELIFRNN
ncbi:hypothetical protein PGIGA_G00024170 [Pangasianodon gigas]|uniref:Uncharacterized protein n=1 Tax=Pangasianodon gigas TaxID=30993 RepID=A0ACC5WW68_PANGG|nr:hypothetical protein [Pangasianodon gigas]